MSEILRNFVSDLIDERFSVAKGVNDGKLTKNGKYGTKKFEYEIKTQKEAKLLKKEIGHYSIINCTSLFLFSKEVEDYVTEELSKSLNKFFSLATQKKKPLVLVVGLGNKGIVADSLGSKVTERVFASRLIDEKLKKDFGNLCYFNAGVGGVTGILSYDLILGVTKMIKPDIVIAVDALVAHEANRLGKSFQISNAGITPGAGVQNFLTPLNKKMLGCEVIAIGVPVMISGFSLCEDIEKNLQDKIFTPKEIDLFIDKCAGIIGDAINLVVHKQKRIF